MRLQARYFLELWLLLAALVVIAFTMPAPLQGCAAADGFEICFANDR